MREIADNFVYSERAHKASFFPSVAAGRNFAVGNGNVRFASFPGENADFRRRHVTPHLVGRYCGTCPITILLARMKYS